jgi:hypothetical protein
MMPVPEGQITTTEILNTPKQEEKKDTKEKEDKK